MCGWSDNRLSAEEIRELNLIRMNIAKINKVIELKKNLGWPVADSEAQLRYLMDRQAELERK